jgi:hypothetical protein
MADPERPLLLAIVIWFGSLKFMSLGYDYDMILLPPRHPMDHDYELSQHGGALRQYHRSHRARTARRRHDQHSHHPRSMEGDSMIRPGVPRPDVHTTSLIEDLRGMSLAMGETPVGYPVILLSGVTPPVRARSDSPMTETTPPRTFPYGLNMAA